VRHFLHKILIK